MFQFVKGEVICNRKKNIRRGIFQGESLSQLLFEICVIPQDLCDTPDKDIKKCRIRLNLERWRKVETHVIYG